ncbi:hypothetical protein J0S82_018476, partial [Galemys pyrenaicus]
MKIPAMPEPLRKETEFHRAEDQAPEEEVCPKDVLARRERYHWCEPKSPNVSSPSPYPQCHLCHTQQNFDLLAEDCRTIYCIGIAKPMKKKTTHFVETGFGNRKDQIS